MEEGVALMLDERGVGKEDRRGFEGRLRGL